jgi:hypothetical protein
MKVATYEKRVKKLLPLLTFLSTQKRVPRKTLNRLDKQSLAVIYDIAKNCVDSRGLLHDTFTRQFSASCKCHKFAEHISKSDKKKKKNILMKGGAFLPQLLALAVPTLFSLLR